MRLTAFVLGLIGATSPCQLTTNLSALAYASARPGGGRPVLLAAAYTAGKVSVYALARAAHDHRGPRRRVLVRLLPHALLALLRAHDARVVAATLLVAAGLHDTVIYWAL